MNRPTQSVHIIENNVTYTFDAVIKSEHTHTMDILDDAKSASGKEHIRYAVEKPSTISLEVSVLDTVVIDNEPLSRGGDSRSASAYDTLYQMLKRRNYLTVITRMHTFTKMMMSDFVVTEDPDHQFEMYANIALKEMIVPDPKKKKTVIDDKSGEVEDSGSVAFGWLGKVVAPIGGVLKKAADLFKKAPTKNMK